MALFRPYLRPDFFGGVDGRWYGYAMTDALQQARAGMFPVWVGQGEFMFNGSVSPIRLAPYYQYLGILLDTLTAHRLQPVAVQHLTVVVTAVLAAFICYACLRSLVPQRPWLAWVWSALYLSTPALAAPIAIYEMYLSFMAFAWLPLVVFANVRLIRRDDGAAWAWLAASLMLVWICHAPIGAWVTLAMLGVQGLRLIARDFHADAWGRAVAGALLFAALGLFYFYSVTELSQTSHRYPLANFAAALGVAAGCAAIVRWLATGRWIWLGFAGTVAWVFRNDSPWLAAALLPAGAVGWLAGRGPARAVRDRVPEWGVALILLGGLVTLSLGPSPGDMPAFQQVSQLFPGSIRPVSVPTDKLCDVQLGYGLWAGLLIGMAAAVWRPSWELRLLGLAGFILAALMLPVPGITRFLIGLVPGPIYDISSVTLWTRYVPVAAAFATFLGFLGMARWSERRTWSKTASIALSFLLLGWSVWESQKWVRRSYRPINSPEEIRAFYRTENVRMYNYILPNLPASLYMTNGVVDYHLESRLLRGGDPTQALDDGFDWRGVPAVTLTTRPDKDDPQWVHLYPPFLLGPKERLLLRFKFLDRPYAGTLICRGPGGFYREYFFPEAGFFGKSFGVAPERPKILAFWNTSAQPQPIEMLFLQAEPPVAGRPFGNFAEIQILKYDPDRLPVRTTSLIPYRAEVTLAAPAYLETPRTYIPGYAATVNGWPVRAMASPNHSVMVRLEPGKNRVELRYAGTPKFKLTLAVSGLCWCGLLAAGWRRWRRAR